MTSNEKTYPDTSLRREQQPTGRWIPFRTDARDKRTVSRATDRNDTRKKNEIKTRTYANVFTECAHETHANETAKKAGNDGPGSRGVRVVIPKKPLSKNRLISEQ